MEHEVEKSKGLEGHGTRRRGESSADMAAAPTHPLLSLHQAAGNRAMQQLLHSGVIQAKLSISQPGDPQEQQADAMADRIMRSHAGAEVAAFTCSCAGGEEQMCDECRQKAGLMRMASAGAGNAGPSPSSGHKLVDRVRRSSGHPLDAAARAFFEPRFGRDLSNVRIHTGVEAAESARAIEAKAYAVGDDVVFGAGEFAPESEAGRRLLSHELAHVVQQSAALAPNHLQRQAAPQAPPRAPTPMRALAADLNHIVDHGYDVLAVVDAHLKDYIKNYDAAYSAVMRRLSEAQKKELEKKKWEMALEFVAAVGIGLAGGELFAAGGALLHEAVELLPEAVGESAAEVAKKGAEIGVMRVIEPAESEVNFDLPSEVTSDHVARGYLAQLAQGWRGVAEIERAAVHFETRIIDALEGGPSLDNKTFLRFRQSLTVAEDKLAIFRGTTDTPVLERTQQQIERDLWVRWMSQSETNAGAAQGEREIAERFREIGVYYDMVGGSDAFREANLQVERLNQLGRVGVVVVPPFWSMNQSHPSPGVVHVRPDAYRAAGRAEPPQNGAPPYVQIEWQEGAHLLTGDVVILAGTSPDMPPNLAPHSHQDTERAGGLLPKRLGPLLSVDPGERAEALKFLGANAAAYPRTDSHVVGQDTYIPLSPDRALPLVFQVREAVEGMHAQPPLVVIESEEGVMVSGANGTRLILFTVYTSWGEAKTALSRTGVHRVVAIEVKPSNTFEDFADQGVVVTSHPDYRLEILLAQSQKEASLLDSLVYPRH